MKEIKFRAWDRIDKRFREIKELLVCYGKIVGVRFPEHQGKDFMGTAYVVLQQFTGLLDKHGKEIYEGDIIVDNFGHFGNGGGVVKNIDEFWWEVIEYGLDNAELEVIGNIYENPELIKE